MRISLIFILELSLLQHDGLVAKRISSVAYTRSGGIVAIKRNLVICTVAHAVRS